MGGSLLLVSGEKENRGEEHSSGKRHEPHPSPRDGSASNQTILGALVAQEMMGRTLQIPNPENLLLPLVESQRSRRVERGRWRGTTAHRPAPCGKMVHDVDKTSRLPLYGSACISRESNLGPVKVNNCKPFGQQLIWFGYPNNSKVANCVDWYIIYVFNCCHCYDWFEFSVLDGMTFHH